MPDKNKKKGLPFFGIPKMFPLLKKYRKSLAFTGFLHVAMGLADVVRPLFQKYALDNFVQKGSLENLGWFVVGYMLLVIAVGVIGYFSIATIMAVQLKMNRDMRNRAFAHLQEMSFDYYNQNSVGYIHARVMSDVGRIGEMFSWQFSDGIYFLFYILSAVLVMFSLNVKLTLMLLTIVPVIVLFFSMFQGKLFSLHDQIREINSRITGNLNEGIIGAKTIKSLGIEKKMDEDFQAETSHMKKKVIEATIAYGSFSVMTNLASSCALAIVLWKGGIIAAENVGTFSVFMSYAQELMEPVRWIVEVLGLLVQGQVNIGRYTKLMELESSVKDTLEVIEKYGDAFDPKKENWEEIKGDIEFKNVDFMYPDGNEYILRDFNLKIPFGTSLAIVGETGAGKSTLANLICRFYEPSSGQLLIDGRDAQERSQLWLHSALGYVLQTPHLFSGTIRDNLRYGRPDATDEEIMDALRMLSAEGIVEKLKDGLDSDTGEGGDMLSTGEKQLISFARAILADPKIIVLDEATASVDTLTEQRIQSAIDMVIEGRTSVVIAHRLSTIKDADIILVVQEGKIIESGTHVELLAAKGYYHKLWMRQYEDEAISAVWASQNVSEDE